MTTLAEILASAAILIGVALHRRRGQRSCIVCGCTDLAACPGGCGWVSLDPPICTACWRHLP